MWVDEAESKQGHLGQEKDQEEQGVEFQEEHVLPKSTDTTHKADHEGDAPNNDEEEADVEHDVKDGLILPSRRAQPGPHLSAV